MDGGSSTSLHWAQLSIPRVLGEENLLVGFGLGANTAVAEPDLLRNKAEKGKREINGL